MQSIAARGLALLRQPGRKNEVRASAPMHVDVVDRSDSPTDEEKALDNFEGAVKHGRLDRWLDHVVAFSGSTFAFFVVLTAVLVWCLLGIKLGTNENWQVVISDVQALMCYVYDSFLVRQELNGYGDNMVAIAQLQSRSLSHLRMLQTLKDRPVEGKEKISAPLVQEVVQDEMPKEPLIGRIIDTTAMILGHVVTLILFWVAFVIWIGFGPSCDWSNSWQLYMNSATSALMILTFILLANIGQRHAVHTKKTLGLLFKADATLELQLRALTHDIQPNQEVTLPPPKVGRGQRAIFYYADFVGTLVGIAILTTVVCVWVALGPVLQYSSNWWLLIGTYAGLIGMFDGFVLRNMQARLRSYSEHELAAVHVQDQLLLDTAGCVMPVCEDAPAVKFGTRVTMRISQAIDHITSHPGAVAASLLTLIGLVAGSTAMHWSLTGQLLSNVPPSIIESWLMLTLITGHNMIEEKQRKELQVLHDRRTRLLAHLSREEQLASGTDREL